MAPSLDGPPKKRAGQLANSDGQAALNRDLHEFPSGCKPDEITIGRPERRAGSFGTVDGPRFSLIEILDPQLSLLVPGNEGDVLAVGRDSDIGTEGGGADSFGWRKGKSA